MTTNTDYKFLMASMKGRSSDSEERSGKSFTGVRSSRPWPIPVQKSRASASVSNVSGSPNRRVSKIIQISWSNFVAKEGIETNLLACLVNGGESGKEGEEVGEGGGGEGDGGFADGVDEFDVMRLQGDAAVAVAAFGSVFQVSFDGMAYAGKHRAYLVLAPREKIYLQKCVSVARSDRAVRQTRQFGVAVAAVGDESFV